MRHLLRLAVALVVLVVAFFAVVYLASESGEVVTLRTRDASGQEHATRLWVVDQGGAEWVRSGHPEKGWFLRVVANPRVEVERAGMRSTRTAVPVREPEVVRAVNEAYTRKYGAADWIVGLSGDPSKRVPVRLDPAQP
jgi:hypothetical protein